jgi:hypothetical protein
LGRRRTDHAELSGRNGYGRSAKKATPVLVDLFGRFDPVHAKSPWFDSLSEIALCSEPPNEFEFPRFCIS